MYKDMFDIGEHKYAGSTFCCRSFILDKKKPIVISFHYAQKIPSINDFNDFNDDKDNIFGFNFLKNNRINVISFSPLNKNTWYRDEDVIRFLKGISDAINVFPINVVMGHQWAALQ